MNDKAPGAEVKMMSPEECRKLNQKLINRSLETVDISKKGLHTLRKKLSITYWICIVLSIGMFIMGIVLLSVPVAAAFGSNIDKLKYLTAAGFGIADLAAVFLIRPIERIHDIMGDMSQITLALHSFQIQADLRLLEMDVTDRATIGQAAEDIGAAAKESTKLVQEYFESKKETK